jgi:hypothetical protein
MSGTGSAPTRTTTTSLGSKPTGHDPDGSHLPPSPPNQPPVLRARGLRAPDLPVLRLRPVVRRGPARLQAPPSSGGPLTPPRRRPRKCRPSAGELLHSAPSPTPARGPRRDPDRPDPVRVRARPGGRAAAARRGGRMRSWRPGARRRRCARGAVPATPTRRRGTRRRPTFRGTKGRGLIAGLAAAAGSRNISLILGPAARCAPHDTSGGRPVSPKGTS